jgi:hypothetical protein
VFALAEGASAAAEWPPAVLAVVHFAAGAAARRGWALVLPIVPCVVLGLVTRDDDPLAVLGAVFALVLAWGAVYGGILAGRFFAGGGGGAGTRRRPDPSPVYAAVPARVVAMARWCQRAGRAGDCQAVGAGGAPQLLEIVPSPTLAPCDLASRRARWRSSP